MASIRSLTQVTSAPRAGAHGPGEPSCPCSPVDGTMWTTLPAGAPCAGGCKKAQERQLLGRISLAPAWSCLAQLCLLLKLGLPAEGLGFAEGPDLPWAQHTVGVAQSWCVRELGLGLGLGWDTQAWVCPLAVLTVGTARPPFLSPQPLLVNEAQSRMLVSQAHLPSLSSLLRFGGSSDDHT